MPKHDEVLLLLWFVIKAAVVLGFVELVMKVVGEQREKDLRVDCGRRY